MKLLCQHRTQAPFAEALKMPPTMEWFAAVGAHNTIVEQVFISWHRSDKSPTGFEYTPGLDQGCHQDFIGEMFQHFRHHHNVELAIGKGYSLGESNLRPVSERILLPEPVDSIFARIQRAHQNPFLRQDRFQPPRPTPMLSTLIPGLM